MITIRGTKEAEDVNKSKKMNDLFKKAGNYILFFIFQKVNFLIE